MDVELIKPFSRTWTRLHLVKPQPHICTSRWKCDAFGLFCQPKHMRVKVRSMLRRNSTVCLLAPALPRTGGVCVGGGVHKRDGRRRNPAASAPEPRAAFKGVGGRGEGEAGRLLAPSVHVFCIPALIFYTERGWCAQCSNERRGGAFWSATL